MDLNLPISLSNTYNLTCNKVKLIKPEETIDIGDKLTGVDTQYSALSVLINDNYFDLDGKINQKQNILSSFEPADQDTNQLSLLHSTTQLSKITWDANYINLYQHDNLEDERFGLLDLRLATTFINTVTNKYSTDMTYTKTEIDNTTTLSNYNTKITATSLLNNYYTKTDVDNTTTLNNYNTKITTTSLLNNYYTKTETTNITTLSNYNTKITTTSLLNNYYTKTDVDNTTTLNNYNTKITTTSLLNNYYTKTETTNITTLSNYNTKITTTSLLNNYYIKADVDNITTLNNYFTKTETTNITSLNNYNTKITTTSLLNNYYIKADVDNITSLNNYNTKITTTSLLNNYYTKTETDNITTLSNYNTKITTTSLLNNYYTKAETDNTTTLNNYLTKTETSNITTLNNYNTKITTTSLLNNYYIKTDVDNITTLSNYNTKITTTSLLNNYYIKADVDNITTLTNYNTKITTTSLLTNYYNKTETNNITTLNNYFTKTTCNNNFSSKLETYTKTEVSNLIGSSEYQLKLVPIGSEFGATSLLWSGTQLSKLKGLNFINVGQNLPDGNVAISLNNEGLNNLTNYYLKTEIDNISNLINYDTKTTSDTKLDNAFFNVASTGYNKLYEKVLVSGAPLCTFYNITGSSNLTINKNISNFSYTFDMNTNITSLSNYPLKSEVNPYISYSQQLSNLFLLDNNLTGSNKVTFPLNGNFNILKPSNNSSLALFTNSGITMGGPLYSDTIICNSLSPINTLTVGTTLNVPPVLNLSSTRCVMSSNIVETTPTTPGIQMGLAVNNSYALQITKGGGTSTVIDFTDVGVDFIGRLLYSFASNTLTIFCASTASVVFDSTGLRGYQQTPPYMGVIYADGTIASSTGKYSFTCSIPSIGVVRVVFSTAFTNTNYNVICTGRSSGVLTVNYGPKNLGNIEFCMNEPAVGLINREFSFIINY